MKTAENGASRDYSSGTVPDDGFYSCLEKSVCQGAKSHHKWDFSADLPHREKSIVVAGVRMNGVMSALWPED